MSIEIRTYEPSRDYQALKEIIASEGEEWQAYLAPKYQLALARSITYVAFKDGSLCGYSRSIDDSGIYIWVADLLVEESSRGHAIGRKLMECLPINFPDQDVFVMSDVDQYYHKLGYQREGSVFKVEATTK